MKTRTVRKWSNKAKEALKAWFETTNWMTRSKAHGEDINAMTECVTDYINFCINNIIPNRTVRGFLNNKRWIPSGLKELLNKKKETSGRKPGNNLKSKLETARSLYCNYSGAKMIFGSHHVVQAAKKD